MTLLEKSLVLSYLHCQHTITNLEVALAEMKSQDDPAAGRLKHRLQNLLSATRKAFSEVEKNVTDKEELMAQIEKSVDLGYDMLDEEEDQWTSDEDLQYRDLLGY